MYSKTTIQDAPNPQAPTPKTQTPNLKQGTPGHRNPPNHEATPGTLKLRRGASHRSEHGNAPVPWRSDLPEIARPIWTSF